MTWLNVQPEAGRWIVVARLALIVTSAARPALGQSLPNGIAAGDVTADSAILWTRSTVAGDVVFEYAADADFADVSGSVVVGSPDPDAPVKVEIAGLDAGMTYYYRVTDAAGSTASGRFRTPARDIHAGLRLGVSGDWRGDLAPYPAIANVPERDLDLFIALGDTIYADIPSPALAKSQATTLSEFRVKHDEVYSARFGINSWAEARASTALFAMIDDHEVANDFAGGAPPESDPRFEPQGTFINESPMFEAALQAFHEFNPIREEFYGDTGDARTSGRRKLYRYRVYGLDVALFILDARSFRDEPLSALGPTAPQAAIDAFESRSFDPNRTMLGAAQLQKFKSDLLDARERGVTWTIIVVPEPIQSLGPFLASDRFEGYAYERAALLRFLDENEIRNVAFVAADVHGTIVNNVAYRNRPGGALTRAHSFEVTTGAVAFAPPFGPTIALLADPAAVGPAGALFQALYGISGQDLRDGVVNLVGDVLLRRFGLDPIGLVGAPVDARLVRGGYLAVHTYGWTELDVAPESGTLTVTTYGINWYSPEFLEQQREHVLQRRPRIVSQFTVRPECPVEGDEACPAGSAGTAPLCGAFTTANLLLLVAGFGLLKRAE